MDRNKAKVLSPIIQAYTEGKPVQSRRIKGDITFWYDDEKPNFDDDDLEYRIKPEPTYRPFANAEECWQEMQKHQPFGWTYDADNIIRDYITRVTRSGIAYDSSINNLMSFENIFNRFVFADGTPFGIKEEE